MSYSHIFSVSLMCRVLKASSSSYYHWKRVFFKKDLEEKQLAQKVKKAFRDSKEAYGLNEEYWARPLH